MNLSAWPWDDIVTSGAAVVVAFISWRAAGRSKDALQTVKDVSDAFTTNIQKVDAHIQTVDAHFKAQTKIVEKLIKAANK